MYVETRAAQKYKVLFNKIKTSIWLNHMFHLFLFFTAMSTPPSNTTLLLDVGLENVPATPKEEDFQSHGFTLNLSCTASALGPKDFNSQDVHKPRAAAKRHWEPRGKAGTFFDKTLNFFDKDDTFLTELTLFCQSHNVRLRFQHPLHQDSERKKMSLFSRELKPLSSGFVLPFWMKQLPWFQMGE